MLSCYSSFVLMQRINLIIQYCELEKDWGANLPLLRWAGGQLLWYLPVQTKQHRGLSRRCDFGPGLLPQRLHLCWCHCTPGLKRGEAHEEEGNQRRKPLKVHMADSSPLSQSKAGMHWEEAGLLQKWERRDLFFYMLNVEMFQSYLFPNERTYFTQREQRFSFLSSVLFFHLFWLGLTKGWQLAQFVQRTQKDLLSVRST